MKQVGMRAWRLRSLAGIEVRALFSGTCIGRGGLLLAVIPLTLEL